MARHRVPVQALRNFMSILFGFAMGGLNNLVILPWAFAGDFSTKKICGKAIHRVGQPRHEPQA